MPPRAGQPRQDRADRHFGDFGDFFVGQPFEFTQHERLAKLQGERFERGAQSVRISTVKRTGRALLIFNFRTIIVVNRNQRLRAVFLQPRIRCVPHDRQQPRAPVAAATAANEAERSHARLLRDVLGVVVVACEPARQVVGGVEMRHDEAFELGLLFVVAHVSLSFQSRPRVKGFYSRRNNFSHRESWTA